MFTHLRARAALLAVLFVCAPTVARADDPVVDDVAPLYWFAGVTEIGVGTTMALIGSGDVCESWGCALLALIASGASVAAGLIAAGIAAATDAPADIPYTLHSGVIGAAEGVLIGAGIFGRSSDEGAAAALVIPALVSGLGQASYSFARHDEIMRNPDLTAWGHVMAWTPLVAAVVTAIIGAELDLDGRVSALVSGIVGVVMYGVSVVGIETTLAR